MKRKIGFLLALAAIFLIKGCIPSLHPLYTDEDRIIIKELVGNWVDINNPEQFHDYKIDPNDNRSYLLNFTNKDKVSRLMQGFDQAEMEVNLVELDGYYFMDLYPGENEVMDEMNGMLQLHLLGVHTFARLEVKDDTLVIRRFDPEWLTELFEENRIRIAHEIVEDQVVLTAPTEDLQSFVVKYAEDPNAFVDPEVLVRVMN